MGRIDKGVRCSIPGCSSTAIRSISATKVRSSGLTVSSERRAYLCKEHYKEYKKRTKKEKQLERMRYRI
jgi:hypothetical protein